MKKQIVLLTLFLGFLGFLVSASNIYAYPVNPVTVGQEIKFGNGPGTTNGGEFKVYDKDGNYIFDTFMHSFLRCLNNIYIINSFFILEIY